MQIQGILQSIERKAGKFGDYAKVNISGQWMSFFPPNAEAVFKITEGSQVEADYEDTGKYKNGKSIKVVGTPAPAGSGGTGQASSILPFGTTEGMVVAWAKDLMVANKDLSPEVASALIFDLIREVKAFAKVEQKT